MNFRNLFISTGAFLAFGAVMLGITSCLLLDVPIDVGFLLILFLVTLSVYIVNRGMDTEEDTINELERVKFIGKYKNLVLVVGILTYSLAVMLASEKGLVVAGSVCVPVIIGFFYTVRWVPNGFVQTIGFSRLKDIPLVKNIAVAGIWAYSTVLIMLFYNSEPVTLAAVSLFTFIFLRCFINTLVFDIRDVVGDAEMKIRTLPVVIGAQNTKKILLFLNVISFILALFTVYYSILPPYFLLTSLVVLPAHIIIRRANPHNKSMELLCDIYEDANETYLVLALTLLGYFLMV
jgi:4-hydroxybenzoate polyprenyltransferase